MARTHLKNIFSRDTSQFWLEQGATTKVYVDTPRSSDAVICQNWPYPLRVAGIFLPRYVYRRRSSKTTASSSRLAGRIKYLATRLEAYF